MLQWACLLFVFLPSIAYGDIVFQRLLTSQSRGWVFVDISTPREAVPWTNASFVQQMLAMQTSQDTEMLQSIVVPQKTGKKNSYSMDDLSVHVICQDSIACQVASENNKRWTHASFRWSNDVIDTHITIWQRPLHDLITEQSVELVHLSQDTKHWETLRLRGLDSNEKARNVEVDIVCGTYRLPEQQMVQIMNFTEKRVARGKYQWTLQGTFRLPGITSECQEQYLTHLQLSMDENQRYEVSLQNCDLLSLWGPTMSFQFDNSFQMQVFSDAPLAFCEVPSVQLHARGMAQMVSEPKTPNIKWWNVNVPLRPLRAPHFVSRSGGGAANSFTTSITSQSSAEPLTDITDTTEDPWKRMTWLEATGIVLITAVSISMAIVLIVLVQRHIRNRRVHVRVSHAPFSGR